MSGAREDSGPALRAIDSAVTALVDWWVRAYRTLERTGGALASYRTVRDTGGGTVGRLGPGPGRGHAPARLRHDGLGNPDGRRRDASAQHRRDLQPARPSPTHAPKSPRRSRPCGRRRTPGSRRWRPCGPDELFAGLPLGTSDTGLSTTYQYLYETALATCLPGTDDSDLRDSPTVRRRVVDGLARLHDEYFGDRTKGYYGNWFHWEIGIPGHVSRTLVLLRDDIAVQRPDLAATYTATMDAYLRNGKDGDVDLDSRFHTGANLADITTNRMLQGAVLGDEARIGKAVADHLTVFATIDPYDLRHGVTDGFYADGSFVQHASVAYTGSYGKGLLTRIVQTLKILDGTGYVPADDLAGVVRTWVTDGFAPWSSRAG